MASPTAELPVKHEFIQSNDYNDIPASGDRELRADDVGELAFEEYTQGGLGRHMGIFSTTFLMSVF